MLKRSCILIILAFILLPVHSQVIYREGDPAGYAGIDLEDYWYEIGYKDSFLDSLRNLRHDKDTPFQFAAGHTTAIDVQDKGLLVETEFGKYICYLPIRSPGALSLNVIFSSFRLKEGEMVYLYDPEFKFLLGPLTSLNNKQSNSLAVIPIPGDEIIIEYHHIAGSGGELEVGKISHDYLGLFGSRTLKDGYYNSSGPCNIDINCPEGGEWQDEKRSVVRLLSNGTTLGTGVMLNNTSQRKIPYLMTAAHVVETVTQAENSIFWFGYESPWCDGPDGRANKTISGSEVVSTCQDIDVTLLKLSTFPPILYKPYFAGWDISGNIPSGTVTIHHPSADVKKISVDNNAPVADTYENYFVNGFWKILQWDAGTTEGGSSGAPLFNQDHRVIGSLTGGEAACGRSVNDYYARIDIAWDVTANSNEILRPWLDQGGTEFNQLDGRDPYDPNYLTFDTLRNYTPGDFYLTEYSLPGLGFTTGFNSDSIIMYAEAFNALSGGQITDVYLYVGNENRILPTDSITVYVMSDDNGPDNIIASQRILISEVKDTFNLRIDFDEPVGVIGKFYIAYRLWYETGAASEARQFALFHGQAVTSEENSAWFYDSGGWHTFNSHPSDPSFRNLFVEPILARNTVYNSISTPATTQNKYLVFPTFFADELNIHPLDDEEDNISVYIYGLDGLLHYRLDLKGGEDNYKIRGISDLTGGIYILIIYHNGHAESHKVIKKSE